MNDKRTITINTAFFPGEEKPPHNCGHVTILKWENGNIVHFHLYSYPTKSSLNRLANVLCINTSVTDKPDNIEVVGSYYKHDVHETKVDVIGKLNNEQFDHEDWLDLRETLNDARNSGNP